MIAAPAIMPSGSPAIPCWPTIVLPKKEMPLRPKGAKGIQFFGST